MSKRSVNANGAEVTRLRKIKGWNQEQLAAKARLSKKAIENTEKCENIYKSTLDRVAKALEVAYESLLDFEASGLRTIRGQHPPLERPKAASGDTKTVVTGFEGFIEDRTHSFFGRDFLFDAIKDFIHDSMIPSGYFIIRGEPGIGKSAFIAELVKTTGCLHHFNIELQGINTYQHFLANIHAQILARFNLSSAQVPESATESGLFLDKALVEASQRLGPGDRLVIAIDALDEVMLPTGFSAANVLYLPTSLPQGVFIVVTTRPLEHLCLDVIRQKPFNLNASDSRNLNDVAKYIRARLTDTPIRSWIKERGVDKEAICATLLDKSAGNFMYLHHLLHDIAFGDFDEGTIDSLPYGLREYYRRHWEKMQRRATLHLGKLYEIIVGGLAAAKEALSLSQLSEWTKQDPRQVQRVLREWKEFLYIEKSKGEELRFRLYHASFREFLEIEVDPGLQNSKRMIDEAAKSKFRKWKQKSTNGPPS